MGWIPPPGIVNSKYLRERELATSLVRVCCTFLLRRFLSLGSRKHEILVVIWQHVRWLPHIPPFGHHYSESNIYMLVIIQQAIFNYLPTYSKSTVKLFYIIIIPCECCNIIIIDPNNISQTIDVLPVLSWLFTIALKYNINNL